MKPLKNLLLLHHGSPEIKHTTHTALLLRVLLGTAQNRKSS